MIPFLKFLNRNGRAGNGQPAPDETVIIPDEPDEVTDTQTALQMCLDESEEFKEDATRFRQDSETVERGNG